ncbi:hypothetical protein [Thermoflavimicrobium daqui]|jgi:hypothetical protein|uniref:Uncharacterized protein n=1 Tax=Thermoflavimicrobium daqui TaxID=2137476 RepID=A0A364K4Z1_9BACL|nr:hypothetical protein [Thermoflavimicrobium daqui]RAL24440.1 hypothetical protein DL897_08945 [Thermoflavimicrobium daqui]
MHREHVRMEIQRCSYDDLIKWRKHAVFCLKQFQEEQNQFEIEECEFIIRLIDQQLQHMNS